MKPSTVMIAACVWLIALCGSATAYPTNPGFESGDLTGWVSAGQAGVQNSITAEGSYSAWVGTVDMNGDDQNDYTGQWGTQGNTNNSLSQNMDVSGVASLDIWYNYYTWDGDGYDDPGFMIDINGANVVSVSANSLAPMWGALNWTGWNVYTYDLTGYTDPTLSLTFYAGNTGDNSFQSWAYADVVVTATPEPPAVVLMTLGLALFAGLAMGRRRRAQKVGVKIP